MRHVIQTYLGQHVDWRMMVELAYHFIAYGLIFYAVWRFSKQYLIQVATQTIQVARMSSLNQSTRVKDNSKIQKDNVIQRHLCMLLKSTKANYNETTLNQFYFLTGSVFLLAFLLFWKLTGDYSKAVRYAALASGIPYAYYWAKLHRNRAASSYELGPASNLLLQKYRSQHFNMYFALLELVKELNGPIKLAFMGIILDIQSRKDVEESVRLFHYQIHTNWSFQLAIMILQAVRDNKQVENGVDRLVREMTETSVIIEKERSENRDILQLGFFPIFAIPITIVLNQKISEGRAFHYHFETPEGLSVLLFTVIVCSISFFISLVMSRMKNDV